MKLKLLLLCLVIQLNLSAQDDLFNLENTYWLNSENEVIDFGTIGKNESIVILNDIFNRRYLEFHVIKDTIAFRTIEDYFINDQNPEFSIKFNVLEITDSTLVLNLIPSEISDKESPSIKLFKSISLQNIDQLNLHKIKITKSGEELLIDSTGNIKLKKGWANDIPMKYNKEEEFGVYKGIFDKLDFDKLKYSLIRVGILDGKLTIKDDNLYILTHSQETKLMIEFNGVKLEGKYKVPDIKLNPLLKEIRKKCNIETLEKIK